MPAGAVVVEYCTVCGLPPEFCEYNNEVPHPAAPGAPAAAQPPSALLAALAVSHARNVEAAAAGPAGDAENLTSTPPVVAEGTDAAAGEAKAKKPSKKEKGKPQVLIERATRNKRKCVTTVTGLEAFGVKLAEAAKKFGKKFACGASVTKDASNKEEIDVQGDCSEELADFIVKEYPAISRADIKVLVEDKK